MAKRYDGLDILKYFCAFLVICIHTGFSSREYIEPLTRAAVPVFFMISGFFHSDEPEIQKKQLLRILKALLLSCLLYVFWGFVRSIITSVSLSDILASWFTLRNFVKLVLFNQVPFMGHLWYLSALLYVLFLMFLLRGRAERLLYRLIPLLLCALLLLGSYSIFIFGHKLSPLLSRNFLFTGLPFFLLGKLLGRREDILRRIPALPLLIVSILLLAAESRWLHRSAGYGDLDYYASITLLAPALFALACRENWIFNSVPARSLARWGRRYSLGIYIIHPIFVELIPIILAAFFAKLPAMSRISYHTAPLLILIFSTVLTGLYKAAAKSKPRLSP